MQALDVTDETSENYKKQILYTPEHSGAGNVTFSNPWVNVSYSLVASDKRYYWFQSIKKYEVAGYTDHSVSLNKELKVKDCQILLQAGIENLLNKNYEIIKTYPMPGRSFNASIKIKL